MTDVEQTMSVAEREELDLEEAQAVESAAADAPVAPEAEEPQPTSRFQRLFGQVFKFGLVGVSNTLISYAVYALLVFVGCHYIIANVISYFAGVTNSFYWNSRYVFKTEEGEKRSPWKVFLKTCAVSAFTGLVVNNVLLVLWVEVLGISAYIGPILNLCVTFPMNFIFNKFWAYRKDGE